MKPKTSNATQSVATQMTNIAAKASTRRRCRPGDIAMITPPRELIEAADHMAGMLVRVLYWDAAPGGHGWRVESLGSDLRQDFVHPEAGKYLSSRMRRNRLMRDSYLTPIRRRRGKDQMALVAPAPGTRTEG